MRARFAPSRPKPNRAIFTLALESMDMIYWEGEMYDGSEDEADGAGGDG